MSSIQENKRIARRFLELVGEHKVEEGMYPFVKKLLIGLRESTRKTYF